METISKEELAWLAGIIDGEGCIQVGSRDTTRELSYQIRVEVSNTDPYMIYKISQLYVKLGVKFCYAFGKNKANNQFLRILLNSMNNVKIVLEAIAPYLVNKLLQANLVLHFIEWRFSLPHKVIGEEKQKVIGAYTQLHNALKAAHRERFNLQRLPRQASKVLDLSKLEVMV